MKKLIFVLGLLVVLVMPTLADDFLDSLGEQREFVKTSLRITTASQRASNADIEDKIREGYSIFENALAAITITDTITSVAYQVGYNLDSLITRVDLVYWQDTALFKVLRLIDPDSLNNLYYEGFSLLGKSGVEAIPGYYSWNQGRINFYPPFAGAGESVYVIGRGRVKNIMVSTLYWDTGVAFSDTTDCDGTCDSTSNYEFVANFPVNYRSIPVTYAIWQIAIMTKEWDYAAKYEDDLRMQLQLIGLNIDVFKESPKKSTVKIEY